MRLYIFIANRGLTSFYRDEADKEPKAYKGNDFVTDVNTSISMKSVMKR